MRRHRPQHWRTSRQWHPPAAMRSVKLRTREQMNIWAVFMAAESTRHLHTTRKRCDHNEATVPSSLSAIPNTIASDPYRRHFEKKSADATSTQEFQK